MKKNKNSFDNIFDDETNFDCFEKSDYIDDDFDFIEDEEDEIFKENDRLLQELLKTIKETERLLSKNKK